MAGWTATKYRDQIKWDGTILAEFYEGDASRLINIPAGAIKLNEVLNPDASKTFNLGNDKFLTFTSVDRTPTADEGTFNWEAKGNFTGDLCHIHQHTGNAGVGTILLRIEAEDSDAIPLVISGAHAVSIEANAAVSAANVYASSRIGIGTASPDEELHVVGDIKLTQDMQIANSRGLVWQGNNAYKLNFNSSGDIILNPTTGDVGIGTDSPGTFSSQGSNLKTLKMEAIRPQILFKSGLAASTQEARILFDGAGMFFDVVGNADATKNDITFRTNSTNSNFSPEARMTIQSDGNVGIGLTSPQAPLHIMGGMNIEDAATPYINFKEPNNAQKGGIGYYHSDNTLRFAVGSAGLITDTIMTIASGANVGIGVTDPDDKLEVAGNIHSNKIGVGAKNETGFLGLFDNTGTEYIRFIKNGTSPPFWDMEVNAAFAFNFGTNSTSNILVMETGGNVGIGTDIPHAKLEVSGAILTQGLSGATIQNTGDHNTSAAAYCVGTIVSDAETPPSAAEFPQGTVFLQYTL